MWSTSCLVRNMRSKNRSTFIVVIVLGFFIMTVLFAYSAFGQDSIDTLQQAHVVSGFLFVPYPSFIFHLLIYSLGFQTWRENPFFIL
jgi:hypothetical protein